MNKPEPKVVERKIGDEVFRLETGRLAGQANGAVLSTVGETTVLATATSSAPRGDADFFPLTVDVEERMYAAGKIPGGFFRREGKSSEKAILLCRLIDRPLRPVVPRRFPERGPRRRHDPGRRWSEPDGHPRPSTRRRPPSPSPTSPSRARSGACGCRTSTASGSRTRPRKSSSTRRSNSWSQGVVNDARRGRHHDDRGRRPRRELFELIEEGDVAPDEELLADGIEVLEGIHRRVHLPPERARASRPARRRSTVGEGHRRTRSSSTTRDEIMERVKAEAEGAISEAITITSEAGPPAETR